MRSRIAIFRVLFGSLALTAGSAYVGAADALPTPTLVSPSTSPHTFTVSQVIGGFPAPGTAGCNNGYGPLAFLPMPAGGVLISSRDGSIYTLAKDEMATQMYSNASPVAPALGPATVPSAMALVLDSTGTLRYFVAETGETGGPTLGVQELTVAGLPTGPLISIPHAVGMASYPTGGRNNLFAGHLLVTAGAGVYDVTPALGTTPGSASFLFSVPVNYDSIAISEDGGTAFVIGAKQMECGTDQIFGYNLVSTVPGVPLYSVVFTSPSVAGGMDGVAVGMGSLQGYIYANDNDGTITEIALTSPHLPNLTPGPSAPDPTSPHTIVQGGSRGDFISTDPNVKSGGYPSYVFSQTDGFWRLTVADGSGGWFGPNMPQAQFPVIVPAIPPFASVVLGLLLVMAGALALARHGGCAGACASRRDARMRLSAKRSRPPESEYRLSRIPRSESGTTASNRRSTSSSAASFFFGRMPSSRRRAVLMSIWSAPCNEPEG
jgi:hypothetical protein